MHPTIVQFGAFAIHSYGLLLAVAFLVSIQIFLARGKARGIPEDRLSTLSLVLLLLAIIGGRALFVFTHWDEYAQDPLGVFRLWEGGLMLYGGYFLAITGGIVYVRRAGLPVWRIADAAAPSMAIGVGIGRLGCFFNGCCFGLPTHLPWGIHFPPQSYSNAVFPGESLHPSQLYMAGAGLALFVTTLALDRKPRFDGWLFWVYVALDATLRFVIDFTRYYDETSFIGRVGSLSFNVNQVLSAILFLAAMIMLRVLSRRPPMPVPAPLQPAPAPGDPGA
jgi:phosphatidylglycerol:prolipoprotein diacylglycerol transferase